MLSDDPIYTHLSPEKSAYTPDRPGDFSRTVKMPRANFSVPCHAMGLPLCVPVGIVYRGGPLQYTECRDAFLGRGKHETCRIKPDTLLYCNYLNL